MDKVTLSIIFALVGIIVGIGIMLLINYFKGNNAKNKADSLFIVNYDEMEVIYTKGIKIEGKVKYKLSDIIKTPEKKEWILHNRMLE